MLPINREGPFFQIRFRFFLSEVCPTNNISNLQYIDNINTLIFCSISIGVLKNFKIILCFYFLFAILKVNRYISGYQGAVN